MFLKSTPARAAITDFLRRSSSPVDVEEIINFLRSKKLKTNKVTVYRNIEFLYKNKVVERLEFGEGKFRYEIKKRHHHHHLICTNCGKIEEVKGDFLKKMEEEIYKNKNFKVTGHSLEFFGLCRSCQQQQN